MPRGRTIPKPPPPVEEFFEVEKILAKRVVKGLTEYLVKWKGFDDADATWEAAGNLASVLDIVLDFESQQPEEHPADHPKAEELGRKKG